VRGHQLPFGLIWWSCTFPVGTCVTGTSGLDLHTGADAFRSRARIVAAADETRRRTERDLHDGTQQQLVSLVLDLQAVQAAVPPGLAELEGD
jgi:hypothetical protein